MIRLLTMTLGGEGYLNFMGNEFGHPEWIDFPREGNDNSYHYCRRQWSLRDNKQLRFAQLAEWDIQMMNLEKVFKSMLMTHQFVSLAEETDKVIVFERGKLLFVFNFHPTQSHTEYKVGTPWSSDHFILLESDAQEFGGHKRLDEARSIWFEAFNQPANKRRYHLKLYLPSRSCIVLCPYENAVDVTDQLPSMPKVTDKQKYGLRGNGMRPPALGEKKTLEPKMPGKEEQEQEYGRQILTESQSAKEKPQGKFEDH